MTFVQTPAFTHTPIVSLWRSQPVRTLLDKLIATRPTTLACMHGSAWRGDGASLLTALADALDA